MRQYLTEGVTGAFPFIVDRTQKPVSESRPNGSGYTRIPGRFSVCDCVNGNNRRYSKHVWEKNLKNGSVLQESITRNAAFGLLEHPKDGIVTLLSPISHHVTKAAMAESQGPTGEKIHEVVGEIIILDTEEGKKLKALIEGGYNPLVSSRGYGSLKRAADGVDEVDEDYVCEGWDVVIKPSFENAELTPSRSSTDAKMAPPVAPNPQAESVILKPGQQANVVILKEDDAALTQRLASEGKVIVTKEAAATITLKESSPSSGAVKPTSETTNRKTTMDLNEIKMRIDALRSPDNARPQRVAESMTQVEELHQNVAEWAAADPKRSWEAQKLHTALTGITENFNNTMRLPAVEAKRLTEQNNKLMKVINAVAATALTYKKKLGESLKGASTGGKLIEELTRRGQGWQRLAETRKDKYVKLEKDFNTSCEALDIMAQRYHEDMTELGRRLIVLEFKDKAQTPEIQKSLKEATRLRHIVTIREKLEGKPVKGVQEAGVEGKQPAEGEVPGKEGIKDDKQKGAGSPDAGKVAKEPGAVTNESKLPPVIPQASVVKSERADMSVRSITESVELVRRLSTVPAK